MPHGLIPYIFITLGLLGNLALFFSVKRELHTDIVKSRKRMQEFTDQLDAANARAMEIVYLPAAPRAGLNVSKRVQAIRMLRRNQEVSHIAAALGVTRKEVELLIHVHRVTQAKSKAAGSLE
jgi:hypothetical protein